MDKNKKIDRSGLTIEQVAALDQYENAEKQLKQLQEIGSIVEELVVELNKQQDRDTDSTQKMGSLLMDMRTSLSAIKDRPELTPDSYTEPIVSAMTGLEKALTTAIKSINVSPKSPDVKVEAPNVTTEVDLSGVEKELAKLPKAFDQAIKSIPTTEIPEVDYSPMIGVLERMSEQLESIDTATRLKPLPGSMKVTNMDGSQIGSTALPSSFAVNQVTTPGTAAQFGSQALSVGVIVQALSTNTANVYIGGSSVSSSVGFELQPGQATSVAVSNTNALYVIGTSGNKICWIGS